MMLPVLSSEHFVYHYMQKLAVVRVYPQSYHVLDDSKISSIMFMAVDHILGQQQCFACDGIQNSILFYTKYSDDSTGSII